MIQNQTHFMDDMWAGSQYMSSASLTPLALGEINISGSFCSIGESFGFIFMLWKEAETPRSSLFTCMKRFESSLDPPLPQVPRISSSSSTLN